jgi:hypothetical protein
LQEHSPLTCLMISWELPFTSSYQTPRDSAVVSPKIRASYSAMLLVAFKLRCTIYLKCSPSGVKTKTPASPPPPTYLRRRQRRESSEARGRPELWAPAHRHPGPWVAWWWRPVGDEFGQHLALDRVARYEVQLKFSQLCSSLSNVANRVMVVEHTSQWI